MIAFVRGTLVTKEPARAVVDVGGIGYELSIPLSSFDRLPPEGGNCHLLTHDHVREDAHELFGFATADERELFRLLLGVSGIGPKTALSALSGLSVRDLKSAIVTGDVKRLGTISGIGRKTAERMALELKDKISPADALEAVSGAGTAVEPRQQDAVMALVSLGFKQVEAARRVQEVAGRLGPDVPVEELIRRALAG